MGAALSSILWRSPAEVAKAERKLKRASVNRNTRALGAALIEVKQARTECLRREVEARNAQAEQFETVE